MIMMQKKKVIILDTSVLCVWIQVPGKEVAGEDGFINKEYVDKHIKEEIEKGAQLVLPLTTLIETGNFIAHTKTGNRQPSIVQMVDIINRVADGTTPWLTLDSQSHLLKGEALKSLAADWSNTVINEDQSIGDAAIVKVAKYMALNFEVEIFTGDGGLKNYEYKIAGQQLRRNRK